MRKLTRGKQSELKNLLRSLRQSGVDAQGELTKDIDKLHLLKQKAVEEENYGEAESITQRIRLKAKEQAK